MKTLSIWEFEDYCNREDHGTYIYSTANQRKKPKNVREISIYNCIHITYNPNAIVLQNGRSNLCISGLKNIMVHNKDNEVGETFDIICASDNESEDEIYTILKL